MRRDKTLKVCANHLSTSSLPFVLAVVLIRSLILVSSVSSEMRLQPNVGSDRSWVWKVAADYSEDPPTSETLAIRFANSDSEFSSSI
jgi:Ran-binding protein 1